MSANDSHIYKGHLDHEDTDLLVTIWGDGKVEAATRPGTDATHRSWGPPVSLVAEMVGWMASSPEGHVAGDPR